MWSLASILVSASNVGTSMFTKMASREQMNTDTMKFNVWRSGVALLLFVVLWIWGLEIHIPTIIHGSVYGISLFFSSYYGYMALKNGSMAITSLIVSYSVVMPCLYGIIFLNENVGLLRAAGILMLLVSMYLLNKQAQELKFSKKWLIYVVITFLCNGFNSINQKIHQTVYPSQYCKEYIVYAFVVITVLFFVVSVVKKGNNGNSCIKCAVPAGIFMGLANYLPLVLSAKVDATVLFPLITIFGMIFNVTISKFLFKDKFSILQIVGIAVGVASVLLIK